MKKLKILMTTGLALGVLPALFDIFYMYGFPGV
jgi:hypothetical protein